MSNTNDMLNDPEILRELIMDHYQYPHNHKLTEEADYKSVHMASDSCIDDITVQSKIKDGKIEDIRFDGVACTISTASTSMMTDLLKGKTVEEAWELSNKAVAEALDGLPPVKMHCSVLAEQAIKAALVDYAQKNNIDIPELEGFEPDHDHDHDHGVEDED